MKKILSKGGINMRLEGEYYRWSDADNMGNEIDFKTFLIKCGVEKRLILSSSTGW